MQHAVQAKPNLTPVLEGFEDRVVPYAPSAMGAAALAAPAAPTAASQTVIPITINAVNVVGAPDVATLVRLADMAASGELEVSIEEVFSLDRVADALAKFAGGKRGKIAISIAES